MADVASLLDHLPEPVRRRVLTAATPIEAPAGTVLFRPGEACALYLLPLRGTVRVQLVTASGHEIVLYRVEPGQTCVLTTSCLLAHEAYAAEGVAETPLRGLGLPPATFDQLMAESADFRDVVFASFGRRLADLMLLLNEVAFRRIDARLAEWLLRQAGSEGVVRTTHRTVANELGTAREVVSRQLEAFARQGLVRLARGRVVVTESRGLRRIAAMGDRGSAR